LSYVRYIVEGYRVDVEVSNTRALVLKTSPQDLSTLLSMLSKYGVLHSSPYRDEYTTMYKVYVLSAQEGVQDAVRDIKSGGVGEIEGEIDLGTLPYNADVVGSIAYRGLRMYLYKSCGWSRASGGKLYSKSLSVTPNEVKQLTKGVLEVYKAVKLGLDVVSNDPYLFVDARRKLEITKDLEYLENSLGAKLNSVTWFKVLDATTSFIVATTGNKGVTLSDILKVVPRNRVEEIVNRAVKYLADIGKIDSSWAKKQYSIDDLYRYALISKSLTLKQTLSAKGLMLRDPSKNIEVLFLPRKMLTPVPTLDAIKRLFFSDSDAGVGNPYNQLVEMLKLSPKIRHSEIQDFVNELAKSAGISLGPLTLAVDTSPITLASVIPAEPKYVEVVDRDAMRGIKDTITSLSLSTLSHCWSIYEKLRNIRNSLRLAIVSIGKDSNIRDFLKKLQEELCKDIKDINMCQEVFNKAVTYREYDDINEFINNLKDIIAEVKHGNREFYGLLVVGPETHINSRSVRDEVEYLTVLEGAFCRYIVRRGEVYYKFISALGSFIVVAAKMLSHKFKPFEISVHRKKLIVDSVIGIDSTTIGLEKGSYRVACAITVLNLSQGKYAVTSITKLSDEGEDAALAEVLKDVMRKNIANDRVAVIYINRAKPETILYNHLPKEDVDNILSKAVIVGATKTHSYSRVIKLTDIHGDPVNPEPGISIPLRVKEKMKRINAFISKYLFVPIEPPQKIKSVGTVIPLLITIIAGKELAADRHLERKLLSFTTSLIALNNISKLWAHSLPWPLHEANRKLRAAQRLAPEPSLIVKLLQNELIFGVL